MSRIQIERLKNDKRELNHQIRRLQKRGNDSKAHRLMVKESFLHQTIEDLTASSR
jgi:uncharacterized membrane protein (DUF106 family)